VPRAAGSASLAGRSRGERENEQALFRVRRQRLDPAARDAGPGSLTDQNWKDRPRSDSNPNAGPSNFRLRLADNWGMGKVMTKVRLTNFADIENARRGHLPAKSVRTLEIDALVDTGATTLVLPRDVSERLGLSFEGTRVVRYANGATAEVPWVTVRVEILGRETTCDALVHEAGATALIGQIPLEALDLVVDPGNLVVSVNPASPDAPILDILAASTA
jgi:clan AA aspartic protease